MFKKIKNYFIEDALAEQKTVFGRVKIYTLYSLVVFHTITYILGSIPIFSGNYPLLQMLQIVGFSFIVGIAISLKQSKNYKLPGIVWMIGGIIYTLFVAVISQGELAYVSFSAIILNILVSFLVLDTKLLLINLVYYIGYFLASISILYGYIPKIDIGLHLARELEFLDQSNLAPISLIIIMIAYITDVYSSSHQKAIERIFTQQDNAIIDQELISKKSLSIDNSMDYAVEIQNSILSHSEKFQGYFGSYFVLFKPKTKLSGVFYWTLERDDIIYFALINTAEEGISGAILSIICQNGLRKGIQELKLTSPASIMEYLNSYLEGTMPRNSENSGISVSVCSFNKRNKKLYYSGANSPIYVLRNDVIQEYKDSSKSIGPYSGSDRYNNVEIQLNINNTVYLFSSAYPCQFGGENNERLGADAFKKILTENRSYSLQDQEERISMAFENWKGKIDQTGDVCLIGLKL